MWTEARRRAQQEPDEETLLDFVANDTAKSLSERIEKLLQRVYKYEDDGEKDEKKRLIRGMPILWSDFMRD